DRPGGDDAQRLRRRRRAERLLPGLPRRLRPGGGARPGVRRACPAARPGRRKYLLLPCLPEVVKDKKDDKDNKDSRDSREGDRFLSLQSLLSLLSLVSLSPLCG